MIDPVRELKVRAEIAHRAIRAGEATALGRLRRLPEFRAATDEALREAVVQRKHCLAMVARESGFASWEHAVRVLDADPRESDFGTLLYQLSNGGHLNQWFASYDEAHAVHMETTGTGKRVFLLAYRRQFLLVESLFIDALGLDAGDPDWSAIGWDWARPRDREARRRLYARLLVAHRPVTA